MKDAIKIILGFAIFFTVVILIGSAIGCGEPEARLTTLDELRGQDIDTLVLQPAALKVIPGRDWLTDSVGAIEQYGFYLLNQDFTNTRETIISSDTLLAWLRDSISGGGGSQTLTYSNDSLYISGGNAIVITGFADTTEVNEVTTYINTILAPAVLVNIGDIADLQDSIAAHRTDINSGGSAATGKSATYVIASSTSVGTGADYTCDGTADNVQIQAAIDALPSGHGSILLREGEYNLAAQVNIPDNKRVSIRGVGGGTVIKPAEGVTAFSCINTSQVGFGQQEEITISDMRIDGGTNDTRGIYLENKHLSSIFNVIFVGESLAGIRVKKTNNIKIYNCFFNRCEYGIYGVAGLAIGDDIEDVSIFGNDFSYVGKSAIHFESSSAIWQREISRIIISANNIEEADYDEENNYAIYLKNSFGSTITGNTITQTYRGGAIELDQGRMNIISSNVFRENGNNQTGNDSTSTVLLRQSSNNTIIGNVVSDEYVDYGFSLHQSDSNTIHSNRMDLPSGDRVRDLGGTANDLGSGTFDPSSNIAFTGGNSFAGVSTFNGDNTYSGTELHHGVNTFNDEVILQKSAASGDAMTIRQSNAAGTYFTLQSGGGGATGIKTYAHGGTTGTPTATVNNQFLGLWSGRGYDGSSLTSSARGWWGIRSGGTWTGSSTPTFHQFATTPTGSTSAAIRMEIATDGRVAIGSSSPTISAALDIQGTTGALLLPRLTTTQRNELTATNGMIIYNTTTTQLEAYENGSWVDL